MNPIPLIPRLTHRQIRDLPTSPVEILPAVPASDREKMTEVDRPPRHISVRPGDKIWVNRRLVRLVPDREQSDEYMEVIDVIEK